MRNAHSKISAIAEISKADRADFRRLDGVVKRGGKTFLAVGMALREIKGRGLYRVLGLTWEQYCNQREAIGSSTAYQMIASVEVTENLVASGVAESDLPRNESQLRVLSAVVAQDQASTWQSAVDTATAEGKPVTARHIKAEVEKMSATSTATSGAGDSPIGESVNKPSRGRKPKADGALTPETFAAGTEEQRASFVSEANKDCLDVERALALLARIESGKSVELPRSEFEALAAENKALKAQVAELTAVLYAASSAPVREIERIPAYSDGDTLPVGGDAHKGRQKATRTTAAGGKGAAAAAVSRGDGDRQAETGRPGAALPVTAPIASAPKRKGPPYPPLVNSEGVEYPRTVTMYEAGDPRRRNAELSFRMRMASSSSGSRRETAGVA